MISFTHIVSMSISLTVWVKTMSTCFFISNKFGKQESNYMLREGRNTRTWWKKRLDNSESKIKIAFLDTSLKLHVNLTSGDQIFQLLKTRDIPRYITMFSVYTCTCTVYIVLKEVTCVCVCQLLSLVKMINCCELV